MLRRAPSPRVLAALVVVLAGGIAVLASLLSASDPNDGAGRPAPAARAAAAAPPSPAALARRVATGGLVEHLRALERIADAHGGNRAAGTPGDAASVRYVAARLRRAGWRVRLQDVRFPYYLERSPPRLERDGRRIDPVATLRYSPGGTVTGRAAGVGGLGCEPADFRGFARGRIAIVARGTCRFSRKVANAAEAGARAVVIFERGAARPFPGTLGAPGAKVPAVAVSGDTGAALLSGRGRLRLRVNAVSERRVTRNVIAEWPGRDRRRVAMAGAHLDSVPEGAGINDNGSGVASLLEFAEELGATRGVPRRTIRLGFWGAEELGLHGSRLHVRRLSRAERTSLVGYMNLDMLGSGNGGRFVYGETAKRGGAVTRALQAGERHLQSLDVAPERKGLGGGSDHAPFERAGVPVLGFFSGASGDKSDEQARRWGGEPGAAFDRCYHRRCDRVAGIDRRVLGQLARAATVSLAVLAGR